MGKAIQYTVRVDAVVYGSATDNYTEADWLALAAAALDQAGRGHLDLQAKVQDRADEAVQAEDRCEYCGDVSPCGVASCRARLCDALRADLATECALEVAS